MENGKSRFYAEHPVYQEGQTGNRTGAACDLWGEFVSVSNADCRNAVSREVSAPAFLQKNSRSENQEI